jgi:hypothetical protein
MIGNPIFQPASVHPYHQSGPITDVPRLGRMQSDVEQRAQLDAEHEWLLSPSPPVQALEELAAELAELLGKRQEPGQKRLPSSTWQRTNAQNTGIWRDQLLAEIEELTGELKKKVARYASSRSVQASGGPTAIADAAAVAWIHQTLEDITATALGLEIASRELFLRAGMAQEQRVKLATAQEQTVGTAE